MHPDDEWLLHHPTSYIFHSHHQLFLAPTICTSIMHHIFSCFCYFLLITSHNISIPLCANNTYPNLLDIVDYFLFSISIAVPPLYNLLTSFAWATVFFNSFSLFFPFVPFLYFLQLFSITIFSPLQPAHLLSVGDAQLFNVPRFCEVQRPSDWLSEVLLF